MNVAGAEQVLRTFPPSSSSANTALDFLLAELADAQSGDLWQKIQAQQKANDHLHRKYLTVKGDLRVRVAELARKDEALRMILARCESGRTEKNVQLARSALGERA